MIPGEKLAAFAAGILFLIVLVWTLFPGQAEPGSHRTGVSDTTFDFESIDLEQALAAVDWGQPTSQGGPNWIFDIFTPPVIYYNEETGTFTVTPPFPDAGSADEMFEIQLIEVLPVPFRFQLVSYAGAPGNYVLTLEDLESGKDVFCAPDEVLAGHQMKVIHFVENRVVASSVKSGTTEAFDLVGEAIVEDQHSDERYTLRHGQITYLENPRARFETHTGVAIRLEEGESWTSTSATYTVKGIDLEGQSVSVEKTSTDVGDKAVKILHSTKSFHSSDLSNRHTRKSEPPPGAF